MAAEPTELADRASVLLSRARDGDANALGSLLDLYRTYLLGVAGAELSAGVQPKAGPSDVVQDTFMEAVRLFDRFQGETGPELRAWLRAILLNKLSDVYNRYFTVQKRFAGRERSLGGGAEDGAGGDSLAAVGDTPSGAAAQREEADAMQAALDRLPDLQRQVIVWRTWEGLPFAEIGRRLDRSEDAARMLFGRALDRLQGVIEADDPARGPRPD